MDRTANGLSRRAVTMLRAVADNRADMTVSSEPDLRADGLLCCDQIAAHELAARRPDPPGVPRPVWAVGADGADGGRGLAAPRPRTTGGRLTAPDRHAGTRHSGGCRPLSPDEFR